MLPVKSDLLPTVSRFFEDDWYSLFDWKNRNLSGNVGTIPSVNIRETADEFLVEMAAPGMRKDDFQVEVKDNILLIRCDREENKDQDVNGQYTRREFSYHVFQRSFNLNNQVVDDAKIKATYQDGILRLNLPKKEEAKEKPARVIKIS